MAKRQNRIPTIQHELRQLENLKMLEPNATPVKYAALSSALLDVIIAALEIVAVLEEGDVGEVNFRQFYDLVDGLEESLPGQRHPPSAGE